MLARYFVSVQGWPSTWMVPAPAWYSSETISSCSSMPRSMPVYQAQLKSTARRSFASFAGVYGGCWLPPNCARAPAVSSTPTARTTPSVTAYLLVIGVACRDRDDVPGPEDIRVLADSPDHSYLREVAIDRAHSLN